jgi:CDP-diacylglycerol--glycerol-3-phosphate 3-phosphatidyltransferase
MSWPNRITFLRILLIPVFVLALVQTRGGPESVRWIALVLLVLVSAGDALDGYLARKLHARSKLGAFLDPAADKLLMTSGYILLCSTLWPEPRMPVWVATVVVSRDVLITVFAFSIVALEGKFVQSAPSFVGKACTTFQMTTLVAVISAPLLENSLAPTAASAVFDGLFLITVFLTLVSGIDYLYAARMMLIAPERVALIEADPPRKRTDD